MKKEKLIPARGFEPLENSPAGELEGAQPFENVLLGDSCLFLKKTLKTEYVPLNEITRCYKRVEMSLACIGCRRAQVPTYFLVLIGGEGRKIKIPFSDEPVLNALVSALENTGGIAVGYVREGEGEPETKPENKPDGDNLR